MKVIVLAESSGFMSVDGQVGAAPFSPYLFILIIKTCFQSDWYIIIIILMKKKNL